VDVFSRFFIFTIYIFTNLLTGKKNKQKSHEYIYIYIYILFSRFDLSYIKAREIIRFFVVKKKETDRTKKLPRTKKGKVFTSLQFIAYTLRNKKKDGKRFFFFFYTYKVSTSYIHTQSCQIIRFLKIYSAYHFFK
jgi:hypothetical protein